VVDWSKVKSVTTSSDGSRGEYQIAVFNSLQYTRKDKVTIYVKSNNVQVKDLVSQKQIEFDILPYDLKSKTY